jgi:hypothetical protein
LAGSPSVRWISPEGPVAFENQYPEYPNPDPISNTLRAEMERARTSSQRPHRRPTIGKPSSAASCSISSRTGSSSEAVSSFMYRSMAG